MANYDITLSAGFDPNQIARASQQAGAQAGSAMAAGISSAISRGINANPFVRPLGAITGKASEFQKSLEASNARVIAFGASAGSLFALKSAFDKLVSSTIEVENSIAKINSLFRLGGSNLQGFSDNLFEIANRMGVSFADASKTALSFAQHGLTVEATLKRTSAALALTRISNLSLEESVLSLTSVINSFTKQALDEVEVVDKLAAVSGRFAASSDEIAEALRRVGASANEANVTFDQTIALITAAQQVTARGGSVIGNSFKSIFTRLERPAVLEDLESAGVQVRNLQGQTLPLIDILKNLSRTFDTLSSGQKSFVAEAVGGVYQVNVLKAIMQDLGSSVSVVDAALQTAGNSAGSANQRLLYLNDTVATRLIKTMNNLTQASSNIGINLFGDAFKQGLSGFDKVLKSISDLSNPNNAKEGDVLSQLKANTIQGSLKGVGNLLSGPLIQGAVLLLLKLFENLEKFVVSSVKDIAGLNNESKKQELIQQSVAKYLNEQADILQHIATGQKTVNDLAQEYFATLQKSNAQIQIINSVASAITGQVSSKISTPPTQKSASGFIPNLYASEAQEARNGGYLAGRIVNTMIRDGNRNIPVIANTAETITSISKNGKVYDFINPADGSPAAKRHSQESLAKTGINPYEHPRTSLAAFGHIPNLSIMDDLAKIRHHANQMKLFQIVSDEAGKFVNNNQTISQKGSSFDREYLIAALTHRTLGKPVDDRTLSILQKTMGVSSSHLDVYHEAFANRIDINGLKQRVSLGEFAGGFIPNLAGPISSSAIEGQVRKFFGQDNVNQADAFMKSANKKGFLPSDATQLSQYIKGVTVNKAAFPGMTPKHAERLASLILGEDIVGAREQAVAAKNTVLNPQDIQSVLSRHGREFPLIAAYSSANNLSPFKNFEQVLGLKVGQNEFKVPVKAISHSGGVGLFQSIQNAIQKNPEILNSLKSIGIGQGLQANPSTFGGGFGSLFDEALKNFFSSRGVKTGTSNSALDILGYHPDIAPFIGTKQPFAGADAKASATELGELPSKIFRTLAGDDRNAILKGPVDIVPPLYNISKFNKQSGSVGILDADAFGVNAGKGGNEFNALIYAAIASGKPLKINYGPQGSGKTTAALQTASALGGGYALSREDLAKHQQFILNKTDTSEEHLKSGVFGLALGSASDIEGFLLPPDVLRANIAKRARANENPNILINDRKMAAYGQAFSYLNETFGSLGRYYEHQYASGYVPVMDALRRENRATGGHGVLGSSSLLASVSNPLGLAAIDGRNQSSASEAINQHLMLGQSLSQIKKAKTGASGLIPNLALDSGFAGSGLGNSILLGIAGYASRLSSFGSSLDKLTLKYPKLFNLVDVEIAKKQQLVKEYDTLRTALLQGQQGPQKFFGELITSQQDLSSKFGQIIGKFAKDVDDAQLAARNSRDRISSKGFGDSVKISLAGGLASQFAGRFSPSAGAAVDDLTVAFSNASQALFAFPNKFGQILGTGLKATGIITAFDTLVKGVANSERAFQLQQAASQKFIAQIDALNVSLNSFDSLVNDSHVPLDTLIREQRRYSETIAELSSSPQGSQLATRLNTAPDNSSRFQILNDARAQQQRESEQNANLLLLKQQAASRSFLGISSGTFKYSSPLEKENLEQLLKTSASSAISNLSNQFKDDLEKASGSIETFNDAINKGTDETAVSLRNFINTFAETGGGNGKDILTNRIRSQLQNESILSSPEVKGVTEQFRTRSLARQNIIDSAQRDYFNTRRLFVNQGSLQAGNSLDIQAITNRAALNQANLLITQRRGEGSLNQLRYGEITNKAFETQTNLQQLEAERQSRTGEASIAFSKNIIGEITQSFEQTIANSAELKDIKRSYNATPGSSDFNVQLVEGLNKGLASVFQNGGVDRFKTNNGGFDYKSFENAVASGSGSSKIIQEGAKAYLKVNDTNLEFLKKIYDANVEMVGIQQEYSAKADQEVAAFESFKKVIDFKALASAFGGVNNLTDRNARRQQEREITRNATLLEKGTTSEIRGAAGARLLEIFQKEGRTLNPEGNTYIDKLTKRALEATGQGLTDVRGQSGNRVSGILARAGVSGDTQSAIRQYFAESLTRGAIGAAVSGKFKPENPSVLGGAEATISQYPAALNKAFQDSISAVTKFSQDIAKTGEDLVKSAKTLTATKEIVGVQQNKDNIAYQAFLNSVLPKKGGPEVQPGLNFSSAIPTVVGVGASLLQAGLAYKNYKALKGLGGTPIPENLGGAPVVQPAAPKSTTSPYQDYKSRLILRSQAEKELSQATEHYENISHRYAPNTIPARQAKAEFEYAKAQYAHQTAKVAEVGSAFNSKFANTTGGTGHTAASITLGVAANSVNNPYTAAGLDVAANFTPEIAAAGKNVLGRSTLGSKILGYGGLAAAGLSRFATAALPYAAAGATAYGGYRLGVGLNKRFSGIYDIENNSAEANAGTVQNIQSSVTKRLFKGESVESQQAYIARQIDSLQKNGVGFTFGAGSGVQENVNETIEKLRSLSAALPQTKAAIDNAKNQESYLQEQQEVQNKILQVLEKIANGGNNSSASGTPQDIKVSISLNGVVTGNELNDKIIEPLKKQLADLRVQTNNIQQFVNMSPAPAKI